MVKKKRKKTRKRLEEKKSKLGRLRQTDDALKKSYETNATER